MRQNYSFSKNGNALLEPCEGKLSCTVLRGESPSNGADLLDRYIQVRIGYWKRQDYRAKTKEEIINDAFGRWKVAGYIGY